jgi:hypothetical protein
VQAELSREIRHRSGIGIDVIHPCVASFEVDVEVFNGLLVCIHEARIFGSGVEILGLGEEPDGIVFG